MNHFVCSECGTKYRSPETTPPPGIKWSDGHVCTPVPDQIAMQLGDTTCHIKPLPYVQNLD